MSSQSKIGWKTAAGLVVANMIGTGVFTSLGFQLLEVQNTWSVILLWALGGFMALSGAFIYAELGTHFKKSGGDFVFLSETLHPSLGYLYAWVSLTVGFSAPIAIAAMAMNEYLTPFLGESNLLGFFALLLIPVTHIFSVKRSGTFQNIFTLFKILFVLGLILIGLFLSSKGEVSALDFSLGWQGEIFRPGFAVSLVYVFYAYTGWNSAAYITGEISSPRKNLPRALLFSTLFVLVLYIAFQVILLKHASFGQLEGKVDVATIAFGNLFGKNAVRWISLLIGVQLIATISGYSWIGPRVTYAMAKEYRLWKPISKLNKQGVPVRAILFNTLISAVLFLSGSFEQVMIYAGFVLQLMGTITVYSSMKLKNRTGFKSPGKPMLQIIYILVSIGIMSFILWDKPLESLIGIGIMSLGLILYLFDTRNEI